jgi:hypothetical protein
MINIISLIGIILRLVFSAYQGGKNNTLFKKALEVKRFFGNFPFHQKKGGIHDIYR